MNKTETERSMSRHTWRTVSIWLAVDNQKASVNDRNGWQSVRSHCLREQLGNLGKTRRFRGKEAFKYKSNYRTSISRNTDYVPWATLLPETTKTPDKT